MDHILTHSHFVEIYILGDSDVHNLSPWLSSSFIDPPGEQECDFALLNDLGQRIQHPTHIPSHFGGTPLMLDLFLASNFSTYSGYLYTHIGYLDIWISVPHIGILSYRSLIAF